MDAPGIASPEGAWQNGIQAAGQGDTAAALRWLERAVRLAPGDPRIALDLANIRLQSGRPDQIRRAAAGFEALTAKHDVAAGWLGLLAARRLNGEHENAAGALQALLSRHCVPQDQGFAEVASAVAAASGRAGWCGIDAGGKLHVTATGRVEGRVNGVPAALSHLAAAPEDGVVTLACRGVELLGSPIHPAVLRRCEGMVETAGAGLTGWVSLPAAPQMAPSLRLVDAEGRGCHILPGDPLPADADAPLTRRYAFQCPAALLQALTPPFRVLTPGGTDIPGSPIDLVLPVQADALGPPNLVLPPRARLQVVVPVYRGLGITQACLQAALLALPDSAGLIVVDDSSPDPELVAWLDEFCRDDRIHLIRHSANLGFPAAANTGLIAAAGCDVLLLNSDTLLLPQATETLLAALYSGPEIGSATPLSNEGSICSYPRREGGNPAPDLATATALNAMFFRVNHHQAVEIPTGIGFCLAMRHDCIAKTGLFRPEIFAQGYGEEVDWSLRARQSGFRHVAATGAYVAHIGGVSFQGSRRALNQRNSRVLTRLYPGFEKLVEAHAKADPLAPARRLLDEARFKTGQRSSAVLLISHRNGGGVARRLEFEMQQIRATGNRPLLLCPAVPDGPSAAVYPYPAELTDGAPGDYPNLRFTLPQDEPALLGLLRAERIDHVVLHHGLGHHPELRRIAQKLGRPQDMVIHDYASFCPRVHLIGPQHRYCGEPNIEACTACVAQTGDETQEALGPERLLRRSRAEFAASRRVIAPSADASRRISRHFPGIKPVVTPWEDDTLPRRLKPPGKAARRIAVLGGIGVAKGYDLLLECARDANQRQLPLQFILAGSSRDDEKLLQTGRIFVTGAYRAEDLPELLADLDADLAFIPSIWPETWCFTLSEAWNAGLFTLAFDLGAQAERILATKRGGVLPLGLPASRVNDSLLHWIPEPIWNEITS